MDVLLFQMGKVASTAIAQAIREQGVEAIQTHWLGRDTIVGSLDNTLLNVDIDDTRALRGLQQFTDNIRNTRTLLWYKKHKQRNGEKLRIITLARDPLSWYWGHVAENFDLYSTEMRRWYAQVFDQPEAQVDLETAMARFHQALFTRFGNMRKPVAHKRFAQEAKKQSENGVWLPLLPQQMMKLRLPTVWFDVVFQPTVELDLYCRPEHVGTGVYRYETDYAEVLLIRYEDLDGAVEPLRAFLGLPELRIERANVTSGKQLPFDMKGFATRNAPGEKALNKLYDSPYCRFFGYRPA